HVAVCTLSPIQFRPQLRKRLGVRIPQNRLGCGIYWRLATCHLHNVFRTGTEQYKQAVTCLCACKNRARETLSVTGHSTNDPFKKSTFPTAGMRPTLDRS